MNVNLSLISGTSNTHKVLVCDLYLNLTADTLVVIDASSPRCSGINLRFSDRNRDLFIRSLAKVVIASSSGLPVQRLS